MQDETSSQSSQQLAQRLNPVTSSATSRYDRSCSLSPCYLTISAGPARSSSTSSASKWARVVHPEGQPYFVRTEGFDFAVVTAANIEDMHTEEQILDCVKLANKELQRRGITIPPQCELVLELAGDQNSCNYYFVDHVAKRLFWLTDVHAEPLGMPPAKSHSHLDLILQVYYWIYIDYFPMHHESRQDELSRLIDDLYSTISHGQADRLTSRTSTFPFSVDVCERFLKLLSSKKGQHIDGYMLCDAARIAGVITNQRFNTYYGQEYAQLDRQQYAPESFEHQWLWIAANSLMWRIPQYYSILLEDLYVNGSVSDQWTHFLSLCITDWMNSLLWSLPVLMTSILLAVVGGTISAAVPSVLSSALSIISASSLRLWHRSFAEADPTEGIHYVRLVKSKTVGFLHLSFVFSLPQASYFWGVLLLILQFLLFAYNNGSRLVVMATGSILVCLVSLVWQVVFPRQTTPTAIL